MIPNIVLIGVTGYGTTHLTELVTLHEKGLARLVGATVINPDEAREACAKHVAVLGEAGKIGRASCRARV